MAKVFILFGTNLGHKYINLINAKKLVDAQLGKSILTSSIYESKAWGNTNQNNFYNFISVYETTILPQKILDINLDIEKQLGRERKLKWEPRIIDIDILYYGSDIIQTENLTIPHSQIQNRLFTLIPLVEIDANFIHPLINQTNHQMLENCSDILEVVKLSNLKI